MISSQFFLIFTFFCELTQSAPLKIINSDDFTIDSQVEQSLDSFLDIYYEKYIKNSHLRKHKKIKPDEGKLKSAETRDIYDVMQGDQPQEASTEDPKILRAIRNSSLANKDGHEKRNKEAWMQMLKNNILNQIGRSNMTTMEVTKSLEDLNVTQMFPNHNSLPEEELYVMEKIIAFHPQCELPSNMTQEIDFENYTMSLYFNYNIDEKMKNVASATLRLYRHSKNTTMEKTDTSCQNSTTDDDQKYRVTIYWYTRGQKKKKAKRRLSDSKMLAEDQEWVELNISSATKAWSKGKNLGLAIQVEDQEGKFLKPEDLFQGVIPCSIDTSTHKPLPSFLHDATPKNNHHISIYQPTIDICIIEGASSGNNPPCSNNLLKSIVLPSSRHIRHQRQHLASKTTQTTNDPRSRIENQRIIMTRQQVLDFNANLNSNKTFSL